MAVLWPGALFCTCSFCWCVLLHRTDSVIRDTDLIDVVGFFAGEEVRTEPATDETGARLPHNIQLMLGVQEIHHDVGHIGPHLASLGLFDHDRKLQLFEHLSTDKPLGIFLSNFLTLSFFARAIFPSRAGEILGGGDGGLGDLLGGDASLGIVVDDGHSSILL